MIQSYRRHRQGFYTSSQASHEYILVGVMDDYGYLIQLSDVSFDSAMYYVTGGIQ